MFKHILVAIDGSDHSDEAIRHACDLAIHYDAALHLVHVPEAEISAIAVGPEAVAIAPADESVLAAGAPTMAEAVDLATKLGRAPASTVIVHGDPATRILETAARKHADLIVSGRRGLGTIPGLMLGSVSRKIATDAACAVLSVK